jgi:CDP-diacylglycerol---glycerol-3-phosphate 3-phosphatidyltransferase
MTQASDIRSLRTELLTVCICGILILPSICLLATLQLGSVRMLPWLLVSTVLWLLVCELTRRRLFLNRADDASALFDGLGLANHMTLARGWLIAGCGGCLAIPALLKEVSVLVWIAAAAYSIAAIFDRVDGFIARRTRRSSQLGAELDTLFDALGLLVAPMLALMLGKIHWSYLLVSIAYYFFVAGLKVRQYKNLPVYPLAPSQLRRTLAGFQMAYVAVVLWPPFDSQVTVMAGVGFMLPLLIGFVVDWCVVSGRINPFASGPGFVIERVRLATEHIVMPCVRALLIGLLCLAWSSDPFTNTLSIPATLLLITGALMMATGVAGRAGAMTLLMLLAWNTPIAVSDPLFAPCLFLSIAILLLGCGRFSLWQHDDHWVNRQDGA